VCHLSRGQQYQHMFKFSFHLNARSPVWALILIYFHLKSKKGKDYAVLQGMKSGGKQILLSDGASAFCYHNSSSLPPSVYLPHVFIAFSTSYTSRRFDKWIHFHWRQLFSSVTQILQNRFVMASHVTRMDWPLCTCVMHISVLKICDLREAVHAPHLYYGNSGTISNIFLNCIS